MSLGMVATVLHAVLLRALRGEADSAVQLSVLRALCTLLLAAPYHRLPHDLLPSCVEVGCCTLGLACASEWARVGLGWLCLSVSPQNFTVLNPPKVPAT